MKKMKFLQIKKPWRIFDSEENFRTFTGRRTVEAYYMYYLTKLYKQQYNVHSRYAKHVGYLYSKLILRAFFRYELQLQPYYLSLYPYYQTFKGVYLKDTLFFSQQLGVSKYEGFTVFKNNLNPKLLQNVKSIKYKPYMFGGLNYIFKPISYKYGILPNISNAQEFFNDSFKGSAFFKNIVWLNKNKYPFFNLNNFFFF